MMYIVGNQRITALIPLAFGFGKHLFKQFADASHLRPLLARLIENGTWPPKLNRHDAIAKHCFFTPDICCHSLR